MTDRQKMENQQFVTQKELKLIMGSVYEDVRKLADRQEGNEAQIDLIHDSINKINENFISDSDLKNYVIFKGQKLEADKAYIDIYKKAKNSICYR